MSKVEVNEIRPQCGTTVTLGGSGETVNVAAPTVNLGASGGTVALACGASATGFGAITWCSSIKTALFTAVAGKGYFINTCGGGYTVTLPATASAGDQINFTDYARTWCVACKNLTLNQNSLKFQGQTCPNPIYDTVGATVKIVYSGATQGWLPQLDKGTADEVPQTYNVQYLVVAGGGGGGSVYAGGGGGAGGYLTSTPASKCFTLTPGASYPITVGAAGTAGNLDNAPRGNKGGNGTVSTFSTITSAGGGGGGGGYQPAACGDGQDGGSGGGGGSYDTARPGGSGNTPPTTPIAQGYDGGDGIPGSANPRRGGGGGGASAVGTDSGCGTGGVGGDGYANTIRGAPFDPVAYGGGGGGSAYQNPPGYPATVGIGGGGKGGSAICGTFPGDDGTDNSGGGGGAGADNTPSGSVAGAGGSGIIILRRLTACSTSTSGTVTTCGSDTIHTFTGDGTFVA